MAINRDFHYLRRRNLKARDLQKEEFRFLMRINFRVFGSFMHLHQNKTLQMNLFAHFARSLAVCLLLGAQAGMGTCG